MIWDLKKNLEDRQVQVRCKAFPRRGMNSPLNYCDGLKHFYDVEYSMELSHFQVAKDFERNPSSNEVVFSELKDLMVSRFKEKGVRVLCSTSTLKMRQIESITLEKITKNSLPASFTKWRCIDG